MQKATKTTGNDKFTAMFLKQNTKSSQWETPSSLRSEEVQQVKMNVRAMIVTVFNSQGIVHCEWVPTCQTIRQNFYIKV